MYKCLYLLLLYFVHCIQSQLIKRLSSIPKRETLPDQEQITNAISSHEIFVYQFNTSKQVNYFQMTTIEGNPLMYGYYTTNITAFEINETDIPKFLSVGVFIQSKKLQKFDLLTIKVSYFNSIDEAQNIVLIYCSSSIPCNYNIMHLFSINTAITIKEHYPVGIYATAYEEYSHKYKDLTIPLKDYSPDVNVTITFTIITYYGLSYAHLITQNTTHIQPIRNIYGSKEQIIINCQGGVNVIIRILSNVHSYYIVNYKINQEESKNYTIQENIVESYEIHLNEQHNFNLEKTLFTDNGKLIFNIKAQNCLLKLMNVSEDVELFSDYPNYIQLVFSIANNYVFSVSMIRFNDIENTNICYK